MIRAKKLHNTVIDFIVNAAIHDLQTESKAWFIDLLAILHDSDRKALINKIKNLIPLITTDRLLEALASTLLNNDIDEPDLRIAILRHGGTKYPSIEIESYLAQTTTDTHAKIVENILSITFTDVDNYFYDLKKIEHNINLINSQKLHIFTFCHNFFSVYHGDKYNYEYEVVVESHVRLVELYTKHWDYSLLINLLFLTATKPVYFSPLLNLLASLKPESKDIPLNNLLDLMAPSQLSEIEYIDLSRVLISKLKILMIYDKNGLRNSQWAALAKNQSCPRIVHTMIQLYLNQFCRQSDLAEFLQASNLLEDDVLWAIDECFPVNIDKDVADCLWMQIRKTQSFGVSTELLLPCICKTGNTLDILELIKPFLLNQTADFLGHLAIQYLSTTLWSNNFICDRLLEMIRIAIIDLQKDEEDQMYFGCRYLLSAFQFSSLTERQMKELQLEITPAIQSDIVVRLHFIYLQSLLGQPTTRSDFLGLLEDMYGLGSEWREMSAEVISNVILDG
ncbi:MAG: hypothetical protein R3B84_14665 [Zavarzinella sp.]